MKDFTGRLAVVTGGGMGIGRELARQLVADGCNVAMCDLFPAAMADTLAIIEADGPPKGVRVTAHVADVSVESQLIRFQQEIKTQHETDKLHLLINNAGVGGGRSMITDDRAEWERTFNICWGGVYLGVRTFLPMLQAAEEAHIVNISSGAGFWASLGPGLPQTAYSAAKFAVKGFTEGLITDLRTNAPHIRCSVVMPGHIGTSIRANSRKVLTGHEDGLSSEDLARARENIGRSGTDVSSLNDEAIQAIIDEQTRRFVEEAPTTAAEAATIILDGVKAERWRILVGENVQRMDEMVRADPEHAYEPGFFAKLALGWRPSS